MLSHGRRLFFRPPVCTIMLANPETAAPYGISLAVIVNNNDNNSALKSHPRTGSAAAGH